MSRMTLMRRAILALILSAGGKATLAQEILKLSPAFDVIVPANATVERVATGYNKWTEGPVWTRDNSLLFAEIPANNIIKLVPGQSPTVFMHPSGYKGAEPYKGPEPGSNGMTLDSNGRVTVAGHAWRTVWRLEARLHQRLGHGRL